MLNSYDDGYENGYNIGHADGYAEGYDDGSLYEWLDYREDLFIFE